MPKLPDHKASLHELLDSVEQYAKNRKRRACVVFDEFQEITTIENGEEIEREMRSTFQHHQQVAYAFLGSKNHLMHGIFKDKNRPFYNFGAHYQLGIIENEHWIPFIHYQFRLNKYTINENDIHTLRSITRGHPYYTQLFCSELWEHNRNKKTITANGIKETLEIILRREQHAFTEMWDFLRAKERTILKAPAQQGSAQIFSKDFLQTYHIGTPSSIQRVVQALLTKDLISKSQKTNIVTDPLFEQ